MKNIIKNQKGFSLIEVFTAMFILSVGLLAVGMMQIGAIKANTNAISRTDGVAMAQTVMETLRSLPLSSSLLTDTGAALDAGKSVNGNDPIPANAGHKASELYPTTTVEGSNGKIYTIFWNVEKDTPTKRARTLRLFVYWANQNSGLNKVIMTTTLGGLYL